MNFLKAAKRVKIGFHFRLLCLMARMVRREVTGMFKRSVAMKIALPLLLVMVAVMTVVLWISLTQITDILQERIKSHLHDVAVSAVRMVDDHERYLSSLRDALLDAHKKKIEAVVSSAYSVAQYYYNEYKAGKLSEDEAKKRALNALASMIYEGGAGYVFVFDSKGITLAHPKKSLIGKSLWDLKDPNGVMIIQELMKAAKAGGGFVSYLWPKPGEEEPQPKLSYAEYFEPWDWMLGTGVYVDDVNKEVAAKEKELWEDFRKALLSVKFGENSYPAILGEDGTVILYIKRELEGKKVTFKDAKTGENLIKKFVENKNKFVEYYYPKPDIGGAYKKLAYVGYVPSKHWLVLLTVYEDEVFGEVRRVSWVFAGILVGGAVLLILIVWLMIRYILTKALVKVGEFAEKVGEGDLTVALEYESEDEIGRLAKIVDKMRDDIVDIIKKIKTAGADVNTKAEDITEIAEDVSARVDETVRSVDRVVDMANNVAAAVEETTSGVQEVASSAQMVSKTAEELSSQSANLREAVEEGEGALSTIIDRIETVSQESQNAVNSVKNLSDSTKNIEQIVETINSIAEQTNLLALNAAIEAARAGEAGKGFAVVADEIRKLAEESRKSTEQIAQILTGIREEASRVSDITTRLVEMIQEVSGQSESISQVFAKIKDQTSALDSMTNNLAASAEEQSAASEEISAAMDNATRAVNEVVDEIQKVKEQMSGLESQKDRLVDAAETLAKLVEIFGETISKFKVE